MKLGKRLKWSLVAYGCILMIATILSGIFLIKPKIKDVSGKNHQYKVKKRLDGSEWMSYQEIKEKIFSLSRSWERSTYQHNSNINLNLGIPISDAVEKQISEIKRIHEEEILGELSENSRSYNEYRQKLLRDLAVKDSEKLKTAKTKLDADLASEKKRQIQALAIFRKDLGKKYQLRLINLEIQKKMLIFKSIGTDNQQAETERIELEITGIQNDLKKKTKEHEIELNREYELYRKRRTAEYYNELSEFRQEKQRLVQAELGRFHNEQMNEFENWSEQRQADVEEAIKLRRYQQ